MKLAWPIILTQVSHVVLQMVDAIMVGRLGKDSLGAVTFCVGIFAFPLVFSFGISSVLSSLIAKRIGENRHERVGRIFRHGVIVCGIVGVMAVVLIECLLPHLQIFGQPPEVTILSVDYLRYLAWSLVPLCVFLVYVKLCEGVSFPRPVTVVSWIAVAINIFLNWIFIFGNLGFEPQGLKGAGLGTFLSRLLITLMIIVYVHSAKRFHKYQIDFKFRNFSFDLILKIFRLGTPAGLQYLNEVAAFAGGSIMMGWLGSASLAAHMVSINLASSTFIVAMSIGFASTVRVGEAFGRKDPREIFDIAITSFLMVIGVMSFFGILFFVFRNQLPYIYIEEGEVVRLAAQLLVLAAFFQIFDGLQSLGVSLTRGVLDVNFPLWITVFSYWIVCLPLSYVLAFEFGFGARGIWLSYVFSLTLAAFLLNWRFFYVVRDLTQKTNLETA